MVKTRAYAYARYSSDNQRAESIDTQLSYIYDYADRNNIKVVRVYTDEAASGTNTDKRGEFLHMLQDIKYHRDPVTAVLVWDISRYARNSEEAISIENRLLAAGVEIIATNQPMRTKKADGQIDIDALIFRRLQHVLAESSSLQNAKQVTAHMYSQSLRPGENGYHPHLAGMAPYGYRIGQRKTYKDHKYLEINEDEAPAVRLMWGWADEGVAFRTIATRLNEMGYRTRRGGFFSYSTVYEILHHAVYGGTYVYGAIRYNRLTTHVMEANPNATIVEGGVPAIIEKELFSRVSAKLGQRNRVQRTPTRHIYILSGMIKCGECKFSMVGDSTAKNRTPNYRCNCGTCSQKYWRIGKKKIEKLIIDVVWNKFLHGVTAELVAKAMEEQPDTSISDLQNNIRNIKTKISAAENALNGLIDAMADPEMREIMKPRILKKKSELEELKQSLRREEENLKDVRTTIDISTIRYTLDKCLNAYKNWDELALRAVAPIFIKEVIVHKNKVEVEYTVGGGITIDTSAETGFIWQSLGDSNSC